MKVKTVALLLAIGLMALACQNPAQRDGASDLSARFMSLAESGGSISLSGGFQSGHFTDVWDLTAGDITLSFTYDGNGLVDDFGGSVAHAWAELGVRSLGTVEDFNPYWRHYSVFEKRRADLFAGQHTYIGYVEFWVSDGNLYLSYVVTEPGCTITETHLAVGGQLADIPQTGKGNPIPGQFPKYTMVGEFLYEVPLSDPLPQLLYIAAHAELVCGNREESAWAGTLPFPGANWAAYFAYQQSELTEPGSGVWLATDYDWTANTFDADVAPTLDLDDKLILQRQGGQGEGVYNLPSAPPVPGNNHRFWWDRDGVDPWQNDETANTGGICQIVITLHATGATTGTAYMKIRGLDQGFEVDGNWNTIELTPAGMSFIGDMENLVVFYGLYGYGATHGVIFSDITVSQ